MKRLSILIPIVLALFVFTNQSIAQNVPNAVKQAFNNKFPNTQNVRWGKENPQEYEAEFSQNGNKMSANFDTQGKWVETETPISNDELPYAVKNALSSNYKEAQLKHSFKVDSPQRTVYELEVTMSEKNDEMNEQGEQNEQGEKGENEKEGYESGNHVRELVFTKDGKLVNKNEEED